MTQNQPDQDYLDLFKPRTQTSPGDTTPGQSSEPLTDPHTTPFEEEFVSFETGFEPGSQIPGASRLNPRLIGLFVGGGCLLVVLAAVVVFAIYQVFFNRDGGAAPTSTPTPTQLFAATPSPTVAAVESPLFVPMVSSDDVRVPVALPERLSIGETTFAVQALNTPAGAWPDAPASGNAVTWAYGSVVNYVLGLAPTQENGDLLSALQVGDPLNLHMSSGLILNFSVDQVTTSPTDTVSLFEQVSPRLTLALLADDPGQRTVVSAAFIGDEVADEPALLGATTGVIGTPVELGPVRVTVIDAYQVSAQEAELPPDTGYLLIDFAIDNVGTEVLETAHFQTFVNDATGERYPLTILAGQFAKYGLPTGSLAPGETNIGSAGYLMPRSAGGPEGQVQWVFNPLPGSDDWLTVPVPYSLPAPTPTPEPPPPVGFARVSVDSDDVFVNWADDVLDISLEIHNVSEGPVEVTKDDISLSSWTDNDLSLQAPAPPLPWTIEPGERRLFQLQFDLPSADSALLTVLGYTFAIDNLGVE
jgi:hypothetical protein